MSDVVLETNLTGLGTVRRGKVRDIYDLGDQLLIVATDRISAFDSVLGSGIPLKGKVLTALSEFWFGLTRGLVGNHLITANVDEMPAAVRRHADVLAGRSMLVRKTEVIPIECVVRGYLAGSGWKEYQAGGTVCGIKLPEGLQQASKLPQSIFTPATKAETGHDENITLKLAAEIVGDATAKFLKEKSVAVYDTVSAFALAHGVIICDTKFEWGKLGDEIILIDEVLTPDSSRFWPEEDYAPGQSPPSFDKQFVRDWLETSSGWDKEPPAPALPDDVVSRTTQKYLDALERITGLTADDLK